MKIVDPNEEDHVITIIPRNNEIAGIVLELYNETTKQVSIFNSTFADTISYSYVDGVGYVSLTTGFEDKQKYSFKMYCSLVQDNIIYRGKILATTQEAQDYKLTKDLYFYE